MEATITVKEIKRAMKQIKDRHPAANVEHIRRLKDHKPITDLLGYRNFIEEVQTAINFIEHFNFVSMQRKTPNTNRSSYSLKHTCEKWGEMNGFSPYVCNMAFVIAAQICGLEPVGVSQCTDPFFRVSQRAYKAMDNEYYMQRKVFLQDRF